MLLTEIASNKTLMAIGAATGYAFATFLMKQAADTVTVTILIAIAVVLAATVAAEIVVIRQVGLGLAYIAIIATETLLILLFAFLVGDALTPREMLGGALVVTGVVIVSF
ncbi:hypothetical protein [Aliiruegeria sabulilitoris]|uniref:hypothetical protein n=1 Tax=Aliiruegeria sabulilitoris TaxID=1510458 RepID=UPI000836E0D6|nr:hypothetical protein [Aliiruegeria sabulilitoris]NDR59179.1 5-aminolevulinate synthase [Pseudoruegeria sp. M32A2M]